jgi:predicted Zn-dependent protease
VIKRSASLILGTALVFNTVGLAPARAQEGGIPIVRDAEIENILWAYTKPILQVAGIDPAATTINLVPRKTLNAFVAGGPNIFIHTGLLERSNNPEQVMGVIAHEVGHIAGSHGSRTRDLVSNLQIQGIVTLLLGFALAAATGQGDAAGAAALGGNALGTNAYLAHSRAQEAAADQAGISYLNDLGVSARGLRDFMAALANEEYLAVGRQSPYFQTHPVTRERMNFIDEQLQKSPAADARLPDKFYRWHAIMRAKLTAFLEPPAVALHAYPESDTSIPARYARAIAYYRMPKLDKALPIINGLIDQYPKNPFFHELKGQMLFENGRVGEAIEPYRKAVELFPESALLRTQMAQVLIESGDPTLNATALANLKEASRHDSNNSMTWHLLSIAYGREGDIGMAALSIAEKALLEGNKALAMSQARRAMGILNSGSLPWLRAETIYNKADDLPNS